MNENHAVIVPSPTLKSITAPLLSLPEDLNSRDEILANYFQDVLVNCRRANDIWNIKLSWPTAAEFYIDPKITKNIAKWATNVDVPHIPFSLKQYEKYQESLNDNWTLYAWSKWWCTLIQKKRMPSKIIIFHLDDHDDLMNPKIYINNGNLYDLLTKKQISIHDPDSIRSAITSSSIGIGEFILPLLWEVPLDIEIRHLSERKREDKQQSFSVDLSSEPDLLQPQFQRLVGNLNPCQNIKNARLTYFITSDVNEFLSVNVQGPILLHVDLDYFNNRYDGCSKWQENKRIHDPNKEHVNFSLKNFLESLKTKNFIPHIDNVTVSTSPGFFPSEYWAESLTLIRRYFLTNKASA